MCYCDSAVWKDPNFVPSLRAFYYARLLEDPDATMACLRCQAFNVKMGEEMPTQERVFTSPIWLCILKTSSTLISSGNHLISVHNVCTALLRPGNLGFAIQVEEPA